jgi:hypothetical protein
MKSKKGENLIPMTKNSPAQSGPAPAPTQGPTIDQVELTVARNNRANEQLVTMLTNALREQDKLIADQRKEIMELRERVGAVPAKT